MPSDPFFDEFKKIMKMFEKAMNSGNMNFDATSQGISIKRVNDKTQIDVQGDISEERIKQLKRKYPDAEINVNGQRSRGGTPIEIIDEDEKSESMEEGEEEGFSSQELALKRFQEKKKEEEDSDDS